MILLKHQQSNYYAELDIYVQKLQLLYDFELY